MTPLSYDAKRTPHKRPGAHADDGGLVTIPNARALGESDKALRCEFGDDVDHWVPKSQKAPASEIRRRGDRGRPVVLKWWAEKARVLEFALIPSPWTKLRHFRHRLQELDTFLAKDDPTRPIIKTLCDALREDLGIAPKGGGHVGDGKQRQSGAQRAD